MTKKILMILAVVALIAIPMAAQGHGGGNGGGNGNGSGNGNAGGPGNGGGNGGWNGNGNGNGNGDCDGPIHNILEGIPFTYSGAVVSIGPRGNGIVIAAAEGNVEVYGLGPDFYWDNLETDKPDIGEQVIAEGFAVDFNGVSRNMLTRVTVEGVAVQLRDLETGVPLWQGDGGNGGQGGWGNRNQPRFDILNGVPFTVTGDVIEVGVSDFSRSGNGMVIAASSGNVTVVGLGPLRYWDRIGAAYPSVGDYVEATGYTVDFNGSTLNIIMSITMGEQVIQLRDPETGLPLWKRFGFGNN